MRVHPAVIFITERNGLGCWEITASNGGRSAMIGDGPSPIPHNPISCDASRPTTAQSVNWMMALSIRFRYKRCNKCNKRPCWQIIKANKNGRNCFCFFFFFFFFFCPLGWWTAKLIVATTAAVAAACVYLLSLSMATEDMASSPRRTDVVRPLKGFPYIDDDFATRGNLGPGKMNPPDSRTAQELFIHFGPSSSWLCLRFFFCASPRQLLLSLQYSDSQGDIVPSPLYSSTPGHHLRAKRGGGTGPVVQKKKKDERERQEDINRNI